ncbi:hypothetical protein HG531_001848 [Fusarium graminearum]|nr:hypothetical protein HG531_001848 [Fusarium graminearum]
MMEYVRLRKKELTQRVVDTGRVVTDTLGSPVANKDTAGVHDLIDSLLGILDLKNEMLRGVVVADTHGICNVLDLNSNRVGNRASDNVNTRECYSLVVDLVLDGLELLFAKVNGNQDDLAVDTVLSLREKVRSNEGRVCVLVSDNENL